MAAINKLEMNKTVKKVDSLDDLEKSTYCVQPGTMFKTRIGPNYELNKLKDDSESSMLDVYGFDMFKSSKKVKNIMEHLEFPTDLPEVNMDGKFYCPKLLVINIMAPLYDGGTGMWGKALEDGESLQAVFYFAINQEVYDAMKEDSYEAATLLKEFFSMDPEDDSDEQYKLRGRMKGIPILANPDDVNLGFTIRPVVNNFNGKPFLTGPKYHSFVKTDDYLECDVDIHRYQALARKVVWSLKDEIETMVTDFGFVVEGREDDELPERMLGAIRLSKVSYKDCPEIDVE